MLRLVLLSRRQRWRGGTFESPSSRNGLTPTPKKSALEAPLDGINPVVEQGIDDRVSGAAARSLPTLRTRPVHPLGAPVAERLLAGAVQFDGAVVEGETDEALHRVAPVFRVECRQFLREDLSFGYIHHAIACMNRPC